MSQICVRSVRGEVFRIKTIQILRDCFLLGVYRLTVSSLKKTVMLTVNRVDKICFLFVQLF